jgi:tetratricopeptide (TPR) repeat protein
MFKSQLRIGFASAFGLVILLVAISCPNVLSFNETGSTGSITITKHANDAARAFAGGDWAKARDEYRIAISMSPDTIEFYYGLYDVCAHSKEYDQVAFALEKIFELEPNKKKQLGAEYGEALYHLKRYDEAIPVLQQALIDANTPMPKLDLTILAPKAQAPEPKPPAASTSTTTTTATAASVGTVTSANDILLPGGAFSKLTDKPKEALSPETTKELADYSKSFENAFHSECIILATYEDYTRSPDTSYFHPPIAHYRITKFLKGPPLNKDLPLRYEFHDRSKSTAAPKGWKFTEDKMPEKGSEWILFIKNGLPRDGAFDTYMGNYGRQPATEDNLNHIYSLLENSANR